MAATASRSWMWAATAPEISSRERRPGRPVVDLDGDGLIEIDMTRDGLIDVDFNGDGKPDDVVPDQNGDGVPEIDLSKDGFPEFGYIPEKWAKETSRLFAKWGRVNNPDLQEY